jgi:hypothetical protein
MTSFSMIGRFRQTASDLRGTGSVSPSHLPDRPSSPLLKLQVGRQPGLRSQVTSSTLSIIFAAAASSISTSGFDVLPGRRFAPTCPLLLVHSTAAAFSVICGLHFLAGPGRSRLSVVVGFPGYIILLPFAGGGSRTARHGRTGQGLYL